MTLSFGIKIVAGAALALALAAPLAPSFAAGDAPEIARRAWSFSGPRGHLDKAQLQRGFQVYQEVCAACHGLKRVYFRNLSEAGGPGFPEEAVKALAAGWPNQIFDGPNDAGEIADRRGRIIKRPAKASDPILGPYDNEKAAAAANNGAVPPDLSLITKARGVEYHGSLMAHPFHMLRDMVNGYQEGGADYTYALLTGYGAVPEYGREASGRLVRLAPGQTAPNAEKCATTSKGEGGKPDQCNKVQEGMHYNSAFSGHQIAMAKPLQDGQVKYQDGTKGTVAQYAEDVTSFLMWAGDPRLEERKGMGLSVMLYLLITSVLLYLAKKRLWASVH